MRLQGPISVTIHIPLPPEGSGTVAARQFARDIRDLEALYTSSPHFAAYVDVHLALSPFSGIGSPSKPDSFDSGATEGGRQFNLWRNVARLFARTEFVMMLDVDFAICTDWRSAIRNAVRGVEYTSIRSRFGTDMNINAARAFEERNTSVMDASLIKKVRDGQIALVLPAFEYVRQEDGVDQSTFPRDKEVSSNH